MKCETMTVIRNGSPVRINLEDYDPERDTLPEAETGGDGAKAAKPASAAPQPLPKGGK